MDQWWKACIDEAVRLWTWTTFRRVMVVAAMILLVMTLVQAVPLDFAMFMAGDIVTMLELAATFGLLAAQGHMRWVLRQAAGLARLAGRALRSTILRGLPRRRGWRVRPGDLRRRVRASEEIAANDNDTDRGVGRPAALAMA
jgi:hypothetical protein